MKLWADICYPISLKQNIFGSLPGPVEVGAPVITIGAAGVPGGGMTNGLVLPLASPALPTWEVKCIQHIPKWQQILYSIVFETIGSKWLFSTWNFVWIQHWEAISIMEPNCTIHRIEIYPAHSAIHLWTFGASLSNSLIISFMGLCSVRFEPYLSSLNSTFLANKCTLLKNVGNITVSFYFVVDKPPG